MARSCSGPAPLVLPLDVTDMAAHEAALAAVLSRFGRLDVLVLNAGKSQRALAEHSPLALTRDIFEINFMAAVNLARVALPGMIARASGQLVVMSSIAGKIGTPVASSYSATKYALVRTSHASRMRSECAQHGYFDALRSEVSQFGVRVLLACPGPVDTGIGAKAFRAPGDETAPAAVHTHTPVRAPCLTSCAVRGREDAGAALRGPADARHAQPRVPAGGLDLPAAHPRAHLRERVSAVARARALHQGDRAEPEEGAAGGRQRVRHVGASCSTSLMPVV